MVLVLVVLVASVVLINGVGRDGDGGGGGAGGVGDVDVGRDGDGGGAGAGVVAMLAQAFWSQLHVLQVFVLLSWKRSYRKTRRRHPMRLHHFCLIT